MLKENEKFKTLSADELKQISGGSEYEPNEIKEGRCTGVTGQWTYTNLVTQSTCLADITSYCSNSLGQCRRDGMGWPD